MSDEPDDRTPRWRLDFPIRWDDDHYVTRRELAKFLTLGSAVLAGATGAVAIWGRNRRSIDHPRRRLAAAAEIPAGGTLLFQYPTDSDPCILLRLSSGALVAYSQVCTHLSCAVVRDPAGGDGLFCPCHRGSFDAVDGRPTGGPPTRRLPRIVLEERDGDVWAVGVEV